MIRIDYYNCLPPIFSDLTDLNFAKLDKPEEALKNSGPLLLGLDELNCEFIQKIINGREAPVILVIALKKDFMLLPKFNLIFSKIFGIIDLSADQDSAKFLLRNYINSNFSKYSVPLDKLSAQLQDIEEKTHSQLRGIKELHDRFVKIRTEKIKGAELSIKFMAGEKSGGEFFDYVHQDSQMLFIQAGSDSYIMSSLIISAMEELKIKNHDVYASIDSFVANLNHMASENGAKINYCIMILKTHKMEGTFYTKGNARVFYNNELLSLGKSSILKLHRGAKVTFLSEGALANWQTSHLGKDLEKFLKDNQHMNNRDFINEFFFEISRYKKSLFLPLDALFATLEIDENVLLQL